MAEPLGELTLGTFLERLASNAPTPGGGGAAAVSAAMAAALAAMTARLSSRQLADAASIAAAMDERSKELVALADRDAAAYREVVAAIRGTGERGDAAKAWQSATEIPAAIAGHAAVIGEAAERLIRQGNPHLAGDAYASVQLAHAAARAAAELVSINVSEGLLGSELADRAHEAERRAEEAADSADRFHAAGGSTGE
jgi:formiminotetrahydrofolate cyclodeaminase